MKKLISIMVLLLVLASSVLMTSCDQEAVDKMYDDTKQTVTSLLEPFFKQFDESTESSDVSDEDEGVDIGGEDSNETL